MRHFIYAILFFCYFNTLFSQSYGNEDFIENASIEELEYYKYEEFIIPAKGTFLGAPSSDRPSSPLIINLKERGFNPGDTIRLKISGSFQFHMPTHPEKRNNITMGLFSKSQTLLDKSIQKRVPDAVPCKETHVTGRIDWANVDTDILEDFKVFDKELVIPLRAKFLFIGTLDSYYMDNVNDGSHRLEIYKVSSVIPPRTNESENVDLSAEIEIKKIPKDAVIVKSKTVTVKIWDDAKEDGDIVSVYLNDARIKKEITVKNSEHIFTLELNPGINTFKLFAHNEGSISPNTAAILIDDGTEQYERRLKSKKDEFAELKIVLE